MDKPQADNPQVDKPKMPPINVWAAPVLIGWIVPGGGHFFLKRPGRGALLLVSITLMFVLGLMMRGMMFTPQSGDLLTTFINYGGFVGDLASGALYLVTMMFGYSQPDMAGAVHDYGTKFLVTAGLLNILAMVDAYEIAAERKNHVPKNDPFPFRSRLPVQFVRVYRVGHRNQEKRSRSSVLRRLLFRLFHRRTLWYRLDHETRPRLVGLALNLLIIITAKSPE